MNKGYLISLAERYKEGEISKTMFQKFFECEYNCIAFELVSTKFNLLNLFVLVSELIQVGIILKKPKNPIFHIGGTVIRNDEIINANDINYIKNDINHIEFKLSKEFNENLKEILLKQKK